MQVGAPPLWVWFTRQGSGIGTFPRVQWFWWGNDTPSFSPCWYCTLFFTLLLLLSAERLECSVSLPCGSVWSLLNGNTFLVLQANPVRCPLGHHGPSLGLESRPERIPGHRYWQFWNPGFLYFVAKRKWLSISELLSTPGAQEFKVQSRCSKFKAGTWRDKGSLSNLDRKKKKSCLN